MPRPEDLINWCLSQRGHPYSWDSRFGPQNFDCSGLMTAACWANGLSPTGFNSTGLELWCRSFDLGIEVDAALSIPGALVFIWGYGAEGHVAMSMGDGRIVETPSAEGHFVGVSDFWRHNWTGAALIPGVDYGLEEEKPAPDQDGAVWGAVVLAPDRIHAYAVSGNTILFEFGGAPGVFGVPQEAVDSGLRLFRIDDKGPAGDTAWDRLTKASGR